MYYDIVMLANLSRSYCSFLYSIKATNQRPFAKHVWYNFIMPKSYSISESYTKVITSL